MPKNTPEDFDLICKLFERGIEVVEEGEHYIMDVKGEPGPQTVQLGAAQGDRSAALKEAYWLSEMWRDPDAAGASPRPPVEGSVKA